MDKYEYKVRSEEILALVEEQNYKEAADIADTIDWRRVQSVKMLCTISDVYKMVRRYQDSKALLLLAYEKRPGSRMIVFALTELCLKIGDVVNAWEYYKEFCKIAPEDTRRYILLYKVYAAQEVSLDEQIKVLEKLKEEEYLDRWAYELAYLYHKIGFATKCVEECDEMILWFGEGKYVRKAMELKMLHEPLTPKQQALYDGEKAQQVELGETRVIPDLNAAMTKEVGDIDPSSAPTIQFSTQDVEEIQVKTMDDSPYNTINLQKALAESMAELMGDDGQPIWQNADSLPGEQLVYDAEVVESDTEEIQVAQLEDTAEIAYEEEPGMEEEEALDESALEETMELPPVPDAEEIFFEDPNTVDISEVVQQVSGQPLTDEMQEIGGTSKDAEEEEDPLIAAIKAELHLETDDEEEEPGEPEELQDPQKIAEAKNEPTYERASTESGVKKVIVPTNPDSIFKISEQPEPMMKPTDFATHKSSFDSVLSQESDGQISLVMPDAVQVEKQITGQMNIQDILIEWEKWKQQKEAQLKEDVKQRVKDQTGELFAEFDEATKEGLLEKLQQAAIEAEEREKQQAEEAEAAEAKEMPGDDLEDQDAENEAAIGAAAEDAREEAEEKAAQFQDRQLTPEERDLFGSFLQNRRTKAQMLAALDNMSLAAYTGNFLITGIKEAGTMTLAKNLVRHLQMSDSNFSGKAAKITGEAFNKKNPEEIIGKLDNGALIIEAAGGMNCTTAENLVKALQTESKGIIVILVDTKVGIDSLLEVNEVLREPFNARFDVESLNTKALVEYGKKYAYEKEYVIDYVGVLALHTRIEDMQTIDYTATISDVKRIVNEAIEHADKKTLKHFFQILIGRRYDEEDMIVLREDDFHV